MKRIIIGFILLGILGPAIFTILGLNGSDRAQEAEFKNLSVQGIQAEQGTNWAIPSTSVMLSLFFNRGMPGSTEFHANSIHAQDQFVYISAVDSFYRFDRFGNKLHWQFVDKNSKPKIVNILTDQEGYLYVVGYTEEPIFEKSMAWPRAGFIIKYDYYFKIQWCNYVFASPVSTCKFKAQKVAVDPAGNSYVLGLIDWPNGEETTFVSKYTYKGNKSWTIEIVQDGKNNQLAQDIAIDKSDRLHVLFRNNTTTEELDTNYLYQLDSATGKINRSIKIKFPVFTHAHAYGLTIDNNDNIFITGGMRPNTPARPCQVFYTIYTSTNYNQVVDIKSISSPTDFFWMWGPQDGFVIFNQFLAYDVATDSSGNFYLLIWGGFGNDINNLTYTGWVARVNGYSGSYKLRNINANGFLKPLSISVNQDNRIFITGYTYAKELYGTENPNSVINYKASFQLKVKTDL